MDKVKNWVRKKSRLVVWLIAVAVVATTWIEAPIVSHGKLIMEFIILTVVLMCV